MRNLMKCLILSGTCIALFIGCSQDKLEDPLPHNSSNLIGEEDINEDNKANDGNDGEVGFDVENTEVVEEDFKNSENVIVENDVFKIFEPSPHSEVEDFITIRGLASVNEGTIQYELEDGHFIFASGYTTANSGAPEWGEFELIIDVAEVPNGSVTLFLFEESAKDGSQKNELSIPLQVIKENNYEDKVVLENNAFKIFSPVPHTEVTNKITVRGLARVNEGTIQYELEDGHFIFASGYTTANSGAPEWGEFELIIDVAEVPNGSVTLFLFEESAKDGSKINKVIIPLTVQK